MGQRKPRVVHYGKKSLPLTETLCGKQSSWLGNLTKHGCLTMVEEDVTCKNCIAVMKSEECVEK